MPRTRPEWYHLVLPTAAQTPYKLVRAKQAWVILACCVFFCLAGLAFLPLIGIQNDEALFSAGLYEPWGL